MLQYIRLVGLALLLSVGFGGVGSAASFDCNKAITETEIAICNDPELSALDEKMGEAWPRLSPLFPKANQVNWIHRRDGCAKNPDDGHNCLPNWGNLG